MSKASLSMQNVDIDDSRLACPAAEEVILLEAYVNLKEFEIAVPYSEFSCLVDNDASDLRRLTAILDLKSFIWEQKEFQSRIFDVMEFKIVHRQEENKEEQKHEENKEEQNHEENKREQQDEQNQNQHVNFQEEQQQQQQQQQQQVENVRKRSFLQEDTVEEYESPCEKRPRPDSLKSTTAENENRHESSDQKRPRSESMNPSEFMFESDGEDVVTAIANVFNEKVQPPEEGEEKQRKHEEEDEDEDGDSTISKESDDSDAAVAEINDDGGGNDDESTTEYKIMKKVLWENGSLGMKVKRQVVDDGGDSSEIPVVTAVEEGSQADKAGIKVGDEFIEIAGKECLSYYTFLLKCQQRPLHLKLKRKTSDEDDDDSSVDSEIKAKVKIQNLWKKRKNGYRKMKNGKLKATKTSYDDDAPDNSETEIDDDGVKKTALKVLPSDRDAYFLENLQKVKDFYKEHGHYTMPCNDKNFLRLGKWLSTWRRNGRLYQEKKITSEKIKEKIEILDALEGFDWGFPLVEKGTSRSRHYDWKKYDWDTCYEMLKEFKEKYGHCYVGKYDKENPVLARWVMHMKMHGKKIRQGGFSTILTTERLQKLQALGLTPDWKRNKETWNDMYNRLKRYKEKYGDCLVPKRWPTDKKLGLWVYDWRRAKRMGSKKLTEERERLLNELGFVWNAK